MRVADHIVEERRKALAGLLAEHQYLPIAEICQRFSISEATARRDLVALQEEQKIHRTFGGAVAFYNERFPSFRQRMGLNHGAKKFLASEAYATIRPGMTCFFDTGTTPYAVAEELRKNPITPLIAVTGNLPAAELLVEIEGIAVHLLGGQLIPKQSVLLGPASVSGLSIWNFDVAFLSAEGMSVEGIWNSQAEIVALQREVMRRSQCNMLLVDGSKLGHKTKYLLADWAENLRLITDAEPESLRKHGIPTAITMESARQSGGKRVLS
jgi:DeoR/GlpR family transcriptional regulator of sugar metabolism